MTAFCTVEYILENNDVRGATVNQFDFLSINISKLPRDTFSNQRPSKRACGTRVRSLRGSTAFFEPTHVDASVQRLVSPCVGHSDTLDSNFPPTVHPIPRGESSILLGEVQDAFRIGYHRSEVVYRVSPGDHLIRRPFGADMEPDVCCLGWERRRPLVGD